ncbi:MAG: hypothetical protein ABIJ47_16360 [Candidatus Bathyarchaeota archaeon]
MSAESLREARKDVDAAITVWRQVIEERLSDRITYATLKGSAAKPWETPADYVPVISDLDIHIGTVGGQPLFPQTRQGFRYALDTTRIIEERFLELRPDHLHIPRPQVVFMTEDRRDFLPETPHEVIPLYGETPLKPPEPIDSLRARDLAELQNLDPLLDRLPEYVFDRIDLEYYRVLRMLCYVVSPSPVRVLSQSHPDPKHLWTLNRTRVIRLLKENGYTALAQNYSDYYTAGWNAFHGGFRDNEAMRRLLVLAYLVLEGCHDAAKES